jgi:hypothetical protein
MSQIFIAMENDGIAALDRVDHNERVDLMLPSIRLVQSKRPKSVRSNAGFPLGLFLL